MRKRLYFVLPDVQTAKEVEKELLLARVEDRYMHFLAKRNTDLGDLPEASIEEKTDIFHGMASGLITGGLLGAVLGLISTQFTDITESLGMGAVLVFALLGASIGFWASGMVAASIPNTQLKAFDKLIEEGKVLLMVDIPREQILEINALVRGHHPNVNPGIIEPTVPAFP